MNSLQSQSIARRRFLACALLLAFLAIGMKPAARAVAQWSRKRPVPIRKPLREFDKTKLIDFQFVEEVWPDAVRAAETTEFIEWRLVPTAPALRAAGIAYLQVHYYTEEGATPNIPHTPEVCYRQGGNQVTALGVVEIPLPRLPSGADAISAKYVRMSNPEQEENKDICAVYTFFHNGVFSNDREAARISMAMPWNRAVFFAKIECITKVPSPDALEVALDTCKALMSRVIPELLTSHFPTQADISRAAGNDPATRPNSLDGNSPSSRQQ